MTEPRRILLGITGNIASGKSTVVGMLKAHGAQHIDADIVYRELVGPGQPLLARLVERFGPGVMAPNGGLDRTALGSIVFSDPAALADLDALTHPAVIAEIDRRADAIREGVILIDAVKLIESGHADHCDVVWLVTAPVEAQVTRLMNRNTLSRAEAMRRVAAQPPLEPKIARADRIIDNSGSLEQLQEQVDAAWQDLVRVERPASAGS
jgi:dephospho-CoA kinase